VHQATSLATMHVAASHAASMCGLELGMDGGVVWADLEVGMDVHLMGATEAVGHVAKSCTCRDAQIFFIF